MEVAMTAEPLQETGERECEECGGEGHVRIDSPGLEDYGVAPEREDCDACDGTGKRPAEPLQDSGELELIRAALAANPFEDDALGGAYISGFRDGSRHPHQDVGRAEQRIQELIAAVEQGMADHMRLAGEHANAVGRAGAAEQELREAQRLLRDFTDAADWLVTCLKDVIQRKAVRGLPEAEAAYYGLRGQALSNQESGADHA
jgi:hypothetical protein